MVDVRMVSFLTCYRPHFVRQAGDDNQVLKVPLL